MACNPLHSAQGVDDGIHISHAFEYADATARDGATGLLPADIGKISRQLDDGSFWILVDDSPVTWSPLSGNALNWIEDKYIPTAGQVTFIISSTPTDPEALTFAVNGVLAETTTDYSLSGTTITWTNTQYSMETTDVVVVRYR